jgi:CubicO group peptidase (beta-lactamase class C family)
MNVARCVALVLLACSSLRTSPVHAAAGLAASDTHGVDVAVSARASLDALVPDLLAAHRVPSASIAIVEHGRTLLVGAWGEQTPGMRANPTTLYNIASLSKPISAEVALRLVARGTLSLDESMAAVWVDPDVANDPRRSLLTPRLVLSHRTGFPNWRRETGGVLAFVREPGTAFGYSGEGFEYLAHFIETKARQPFEQLTRELVFRPIGMRDTAQSRQPWFKGRIAVPHDANGRTLEPEFAAHFMASDLVYSTAGDYAKFVASVMREERLNDALALERHRIQTDRRAELCAPPRQAHCPDAAGFGLGWEVYRFGNAHVHMHTGKDQGLFTFAYFSPERERGVVIFTNGENGAQLVLPVLDALKHDGDFVAFLRDLAG